MKNKILKMAVLVFSLSSIGVGSVYIWKFKKSVDSLPSLPEVYKTAQSEVSAGQGSKEPGEHGAPAKGEHGEAAKAEGEGHGGGHGEGHGEGHGGEHGEAKAEGGHEGRSPASVVSKGVPLFSVDELFVNVNSEKGAHMMGLKLELELFEEKNRDLMKSRHSGIRDRIIELSRDFEYEKLNTLGGKLYFKELVVATLNEFFGQALVKDAHISSFYLQ